MADPKDKPPEEKSSSSKQQSSQENHCPNEKSDGDNEGGGGEGENKTDGVAGGGGGSSSSPPISARKRGGTDADGVDVGSTGDNERVTKARKKGELDIPSVEPTCYVCKKGFGSWKAVFGHLRAHPRETPGAFPPPSFTPPDGSPERNNNDEKALKDQLAPTLLNLAYETMHKMSQEDFNTSVATGDASSSRVGRGWGLEIDLNEPGTSFLLDLNNPPPPENDDDDNGKS